MNTEFNKYIEERHGGSVAAAAKHLNISVDLAYKVRAGRRSCSKALAQLVASDHRSVDLAGLLFGSQEAEGSLK